MAKPPILISAEPLSPSTNETAALQVTADVRVTIDAPPALAGSAAISGSAISKARRSVGCRASRSTR